MKQILQNIRNGETAVEDIPVPAIGLNEVLVRTRVSLISTGTERMIVEFGKAGLMEKARQQPDKVRMVLDKMRTDGVLSTLEAVNAKLETTVPLGYANVGVVADTGACVSGFREGDRVVSNGPHAEYVAVGQNLCARIPDNVSDQDATFTVAGAIALQGIRLAEPTIGESFVVTGLGLIGLLAVQILRANGCRVLGIDVDTAKLELAASWGAETVNIAEGQDAVVAADVFSRGRGVDGVIVAASARDDDIIHQAATMCRKRGRIVLVGVVDLELQRSDFYEKEISFQVSCSYGPGRYDAAYETGGMDYPVGFVRWTEQRNFEAVLDLLSSGALDVSELVSMRFPIEKAQQAYAALSKDRSVLGILLEYNPDETPERFCRLSDSPSTGTGGKTVVGALGAGNYASRVLLPAFKSAGAALHTVVTAKGVSGSQVGRKLGFLNNATEVNAILNDDSINVVVIATRHDTHAQLIVEGLEHGKHVFVEKPLALTSEEIDEIEAVYQRAGEAGQILMIGFNRRFSPLIEQIKREIEAADTPISLVYTCNAGSIDASAWVHGAEGGGRIVGEACHFIDIARHLAGSAIEDVSALALRDERADRNDTATVTLGFRNGSIAVINYFSNGHRSYPKERLEVYAAGRVMVLDNFRRLSSYGGKASRRLMRANRGQVQCVQAFVNAVSTGASSPIPFDEIIEVSRASIAAHEQIKA